MLEIIKPLSQGQFGRVFLARDRVLNQLRAVKYIDPSQLPPDFDAWSQEARAMSEGDGEAHIARIHGAEIEGTGPVVVMEYLPGGSAADRWKGDAAPVGEALTACIEACRGIETLHIRGVLHRDIKPANILFDDGGSAKVSDFGLARPTGHAIDGSTLNYLRHEAPELQAPNATETEQSDVYAMGVTAYRLLCGDHVLPALAHQEIRDGTRDGTYPPRDAWPDHVPAKIRKAVKKAMNPDPAKRYASIRDLRHALEQCRPEVAWHPPHFKDGESTWQGAASSGHCWVVKRRLDGKASSVDIAVSRAGQPRRVVAACRSDITESVAKKYTERALRLISDGKAAQLSDG